MTFSCNICEEQSTRICHYCTKDSCDNHLCERCKRCSDCCSCEVRLEEPVMVSARIAQLTGREATPEPAPHSEDYLPR
jgi:hypothetical protein